MSAFTAMLSTGVRLAVAAVLTLAVLMAGSGLHPTAHCDDHADCSPSAELPSTPDDPEGGEGLCVSCDCSCQHVWVVDMPALVLSVAQRSRLVHADRQPTPDDAVIEVEPPPVRNS